MLSMKNSEEEEEDDDRGGLVTKGSSMCSWARFRKIVHRKN